MDTEKSELIVEKDTGTGEVNLVLEEAPVVQNGLAPKDKVVIESNVLLTPAKELPTSAEMSNEPAALVETKPHSAGLSLLSSYDSDASEVEADASDEMPQQEKCLDSDTESVVEVITANDYRNQVVEIKSDTDESSDSSSSDSSAEEERGRSLARLRKAIDKSIAAVSDDDDDDDDDDGEGGEKKKGKRRQPPKVKGEVLLEDLPPIEDLHITVPEDECIELGRVHSIIDQLLLVSVLPNSILLDLDTVLFLDKGQRVLGEVFDVLGQVSDPLYCVRFNNNEQIKEKQINVGDVVYVAPKTEYTQFVILSSLMKLRGSDASWENDVEPPPRFIDYSDDEEERMARSRLSNKDRKEPAGSADHQKRARYTSNEVLEVGDDDDAASVTSNATTSSEQSGGSWRGGRGRGRGQGRGRGHYGQRYGHAMHAPLNYPPQHDSGSWHSNFYQQPQYFPRPQAPYHMPPPYAFGGYQPDMPPSYQPGPGAPPMYPPNPYAMRPPPPQAPQPPEQQ